jgi:DNA polymerase-4
MRYSDLIEPFGPDEAWLDVTGSSLIFGSGGDIAEDIRKTIRRELGLTVSIGVSFNKVFAKLGSDLKKPDAISFITTENFKDVVWPLPVNSIIGIGPATEAKLNSIGIYTLGGLAKADSERLTRLLGKVGPQLRLYAKGGDTSRVAPQDYRRTPQSIGRSTTTSYDLKTENDVWSIMLMLSEKVAEELRRYNLKASGVGLHLRNNELKVNEKPPKLFSSAAFYLYPVFI